MFRVLIICAAIITCLLSACHKQVEEESATADTQNIDAVSPPGKGYTTYTIAAGEQFCDINFYQPVKYTEIRFKVRFDSSCIYKTRNAGNQYDINKLYGFSDNGAHHQDFSARFGWRWSDDSLRLFAYVYNNSIRDSKQLSAIAIGVEQLCSIKVTSDSYMFTLNGRTEVMPRKSITSQAEGYKLYPYFGGDELAPHKIVIRIEDL